MAIYIAICDDNIADRKHTERLLEREKDERLKKDGDVLYIESFGSSETLLKTPIKYDLFLLDLTSGTENGMDVAKNLRSRGIIAPIALLSSSVDYTLFSNSPSDIINVSKPIVQGQISHLFDVAKAWSKNKPSLLEIRGKKDTFFLPHRDLVRATEKQNCVEVATSTGTYIEVPGDLKHFMGVISNYKCFVPCKKSIISIHHIDSMEKNCFYLDNGEQFLFSHFMLLEIIEIFVDYARAHRDV